MRRGYLTSFLVLLAAPAMAQQPRSIVGTWHFPNEGCKREQGAITISPMELESEDVLCKFKTVKREGNTVIWTGVCGDVEAGGNQRVTATETDKGLTIRYHPGGNVLEGLRRCPR